MQEDLPFKRKVTLREILLEMKESSLPILTRLRVLNEAAEMHTFLIRFNYDLFHLFRMQFNKQ